MEYAPGHVKRDPATGRVALRTNFKAGELTESYWVVSACNSSATHAGTAAVEDWDDLYIPEVT